MKVAFVHFHTFRLLRGIETLILSLANQLAAKGIEVSVLAARRTLERTLVDVDPRVRVKEFPTFRYFEHRTIAPLYFADIVRRKYDIVNIFFADFGEAWALRAASRFVDFRLNLYLCYPVDAAPDRFETFRSSRLSDRADVLICDSNYVAEGAQKFFGRPCVVIPVGTDVKKFKRDVGVREESRRRMGISSDDVVLLSVAALEKRKGIGRLVEALPKVRSEYPSVRCVIVGSGTERPMLEKRVAELGLGDRVSFMGASTNLHSFYNAADIFVMLPDYEANSIASHEAMACELPLLVSASGGFGEVVDSSCGRLVPADDGDRIASTLIELARDAPLRRELGAEARRRIEERLTWDVISDQLIETFRSQLRNEAHSRPA
ncbi:MAG: glycosyltransferase family 4 protein [Vicinamibacteria bacterium]